MVFFCRGRGWGVRDLQRIEQYIWVRNVVGRTRMSLSMNNELRKRERERERDRNLRLRTKKDIRDK